MNLSSTEKHNLFKGLDLFIEEFRLYVKSLLMKKYGDQWSSEFISRLYPDHREEWIQYGDKAQSPENLIEHKHLKKFALDNKALLEDDFKKETNNLPTWFSEITYARNQVAHSQKSLDEDEATKVWIHLRKILKSIGKYELEQQLLVLQKNVAVQDSSVVTKPATTPKKVEKRFANFFQHSVETLDIVNCSGSWQEVFAEEVYICPATGGAFSHRQCKYFGAYFSKRVGAVGEIEAVVDVNSEDESEIYWTNYNQNNDEYLTMAKEKASELRPDEFPIRVFLLKDLYSTNFIKDSKGGMQGNKMYLNIEDLDISNAKELAEELDGKVWSDLNL
ncbi:MAG TPA: Swt1 family HEPN domain-containing protein [Segetibacter sp.]|jgi:hypothetical protein